jgi:hypothetical protein
MILSYHELSMYLSKRASHPPDDRYNKNSYGLECRSIDRRYPHIAIDNAKFEVVRIYTSDGRCQIRLYCCSCRRSGWSASLPKRFFSEDDFAALRVERLDELELERCERCNAVDVVESHHWAPQEIFGYEEADTWPKSLLCRKCHVEWHARMNEYIKGWQASKYGVIVRDGVE